MKLLSDDPTIQTGQIYKKIRVSKQQMTIYFINIDKLEIDINNFIEND